MVSFKPWQQLSLSLSLRTALTNQTGRRWSPSTWAAAQRWVLHSGLHGREGLSGSSLLQSGSCTSPHSPEYTWALPAAWDPWSHSPWLGLCWSNISTCLFVYIFGGDQNYRQEYHCFKGYLGGGTSKVALSTFRPYILLYKVVLYIIFTGFMVRSWHIKSSHKLMLLLFKPFILLCDSKCMLYNSVTKCGLSILFVIFMNHSTEEFWISSKGISHTNLVKKTPPKTTTLATSL